MFYSLLILALLAAWVLGFVSISATSKGKEALLDIWSKITNLFKSKAE